jgi:hypothetical protein
MRDLQTGSSSRPSRYIATHTSELQIPADSLDEIRNRLTSSPSTLPTSSATRAATVVAATLRGCVQAITWFSDAQFASFRYCGSSREKKERIELGQAIGLVSSECTYESTFHILSGRLRSRIHTFPRNIEAFPCACRLVAASVAMPEIGKRSGCC